MKLSLLISLVALLTFPVVSHSVTKVLEVMHCKGGKVQKGDSTYVILKMCGEPAYKEVVSTEGNEKREIWHYDCKNRGYIDVLEFRSGELFDRTRGEYSNGVQECR